MIALTQLIPMGVSGLMRRDTLLMVAAFGVLLYFADASALTMLLACAALLCALMLDGKLQAVREEVALLAHRLQESGVLLEPSRVLEADPLYESRHERNDPPQEDRAAAWACAEARGARKAERRPDGTLVKAVPPHDRVEGHLCTHCPKLEDDQNRNDG